MNELYEKILVPILENSTEFGVAVTEKVSAVLPDAVIESFQQAVEIFAPILNAVPETLTKILTLIYGF